MKHRKTTYIKLSEEEHALLVSIARGQQSALAPMLTKVIRQWLLQRKMQIEMTKIRDAALNV